MSNPCDSPMPASYLGVVLGLAICSVWQHSSDTGYLPGRCLLSVRLSQKFVNSGNDLGAFSDG